MIIRVPAPALPGRRTGTTWRDFLHAQAATMLAAGFSHVDRAVTPQRLCCSPRANAHAERLVLTARPPPVDLSQERIKRRPVLGGLISEYERVA